MKFVANASPPQEQREEQSSADLPMEKADSTIVDPQAHVRFLLPPEEPSDTSNQGHDGCGNGENE